MAMKYYNHCNNQQTLYLYEVYGDILETYKTDVLRGIPGASSQDFPRREHFVAGKKRGKALD